MITIAPGYQTGERWFRTIEEAQKEELFALLSDGDSHTEAVKDVIESLVAHTDEVVAILTCQPKSKKPRSDKGKKRTPRQTPSTT